MKPKLLISFSGGRTSAFMCKFILENPKYKDYEKLFVFANTGKEKEDTLVFVDRCDKEFNLNLVWIETKVNLKKGKGSEFSVVNFEQANRNGKLFEDVIKKYGLPSKLYRHCTRELKEVPIHKYAKSIFGKEYLTALGIRADEKHRIGSNPKIIYPLLEMNFDERFIRNWWENQKFDLNIKDYEGNCDLCFLKSTRKKITLIKENDGIQDWWQKMEEKYSSEFQSKFDEIRDISIQDLVELSKREFQMQIDKQEQRRIQPTFFNEMDVEFDCFCKNT